MEQEIQHHFPQPIEEGKLSQHLERGKEVLAHLLPEGFPDLKGKSADQWIANHLPLIRWDQPRATPNIFSIYILGSPTHEVKAEKVLMQLMRRWLIPEKEVHIAGFHNMYFYKRSFSSRLFFVAEIQLMVEEDRELSTILENLPLLSNDLGLSLSSAQYTELLLDTKALSLDQKSSRIQGHLRTLLEKVPNHFELDVFRDMSRFLAISHPDFRKFRSSKHLTRIVVSHYLMRKRLLHNLSVSPEKRHLELRLIRTKLQFPFGVKSVLGLSIAVGLQDRYETFEDKHVTDAVQEIFPSAKVIKGSYYFFRANHDPIKYLYVELEKRDGSRFDEEQIRKLKWELKENLKKRVEKLIPSVFMIRNEEEVMRNILLLSQELRYLSDLPQVMVNFEKQDGDELHFTVIVVRVKKKHDLPMEEAFNEFGGNFRFLSDRVQHVGYVRKKNPKEANVFHLCIPKERVILRADSSVNFYLARQKVLSILQEVLGEVRDYNGGMILKQGELLSQLKHEFLGIAEKDLELLENFFFSLNPIEAQATASLSVLKKLFKLILEAAAEELPKRDSYFQKITKRKNIVFAVLRTKDSSFTGLVSEELNQLENFSKSLIKAQMRHSGTYFQGYIYETSSQEQYRDFQNRIASGIKKWLTKIRSQQVLRLSFSDLPQSLDPRLGGDDFSSNLIKMLFEGLTRIDRDNQPALALAKSIEISPNQKVYTFKLRPSKWSDGSPLTAHDFAYAWKKILSPSFYTPFAYFFYSIKHARSAKKGEIPIDDVGIQVPDEMTIIVELENPTPEFLEQTAHAIYSPINRKHDVLHPNWAQDLGESYVCNGIMKLKRSFPNGGHEFVKNGFYWDAPSVKIDRVRISKNNTETAFEMFKNDEIDWLGHPMRPWDSYFASAKEKVGHTKSLGAHWCVFNTQRYPFDNLKMRQAFSYAIDRSKIIPKLKDVPGAAISPLPLIHSSVHDESLIYGDKKRAVQLFEEALKELDLTRDQFPIITLICSMGSRNRSIISQELLRMWEEVLGVRCRLEVLPFLSLFPKMLKGDFQLGTINWKSWISNPLYTLNPFQYRSNRVNFSKWEHPAYQSLLEKAQAEINPENRAHFLKDAEELLIQECPVIPIHQEQYYFIHKEHLVDAFCSDAGNIDFKWASISSQ